jgi:hypothetical protein
LAPIPNPQSPIPNHLKHVFLFLLKLMLLN